MKTLSHYTGNYKFRQKGTEKKKKSVIERLLYRVSDRKVVGYGSDSRTDNASLCSRKKHFPLGQCNSSIVVAQRDERINSKQNSKMGALRWWGYTGAHCLVYINE